MLKVMIEGDHAIEKAQLLLQKPNVDAKLKKNDENLRAIDWGIVIEIMNNLDTAVGVAGGAVSLAHTIWEWRKDLKKGQKVILSKGEDEEEERLLVEEDTTESEIEDFLNL